MVVHDKKYERAFRGLTTEMLPKTPLGHSYHLVFILLGLSHLALFMLTNR